MIAIDIGGTSLRIGFVSRDGTVSCFEKHSINAVLDSSPIDDLVSFIQGYIDKYGLQAAGLAVALPGTLSADGATVLSLPNVPGFDGVKIKSYLAKKIKLPALLLKDVTALMYCDIKRFNITGEGVAIACYVGTGLGNAIYIDGKIYAGHHGSAGELGHIPLHGFNGVCGCGNSGCSELLVGGKYLSSCLEQLPDLPISQLFQYANHPILVEYVKTLAAVIAAEINILDPGTVILGGGVISMESFPLGTLERHIRAFSRKPYPEQGLRFICSHSNGENGVLGAGLYAWAMM